jgi:hypothetical protein
MKVFEQGDIVSSATLFSGDSGPVDPASVQYLMTVAGGAVATHSYTGATIPAPNIVARLEQGQYVFWCDTSNAAGLYAVQAVGTGPGQATTPKLYFQVRPKMA